MTSNLYERSQYRFDQEIKSFEQRLQDLSANLSDITKYTTDGYLSARGMHKTGESLFERNHSYNKYEHYHSGYETTMDMPKAQVARAFAIPFVVSILSALFLFN